jgi:aspartyl-tRNA(Asn)/glutamyl-tRNA(Gln) amidotransferase subunit A
VYDALQGHDPDDDAQADEAVAPTRQRLERAAEGLRCGCLAAISATGAIATPVPPWPASAQALDAREEHVFPEAELARSAAFIISASEGGNHLPALRREPARFEPNSRERCWPGR